MFVLHSVSMLDLGSAVCAKTTIWKTIQGHNDKIGDELLSTLDAASKGLNDGVIMRERRQRL